MGLLAPLEASLSLLLGKPRVRRQETAISNGLRGRGFRDILVSYCYSSMILFCYRRHGSETKAP
jgi:hypothetical protein